MAGEKSASTTSSNVKRKRGTVGYYAVKLGHTPGIYYSWDDAKEQTLGFKNPICAYSPQDQKV
jgi:ribonuclease HI